MSGLWGGIEAGGTKFVCAIGAGPDDIRAQTRIATTSPRETIGYAVDFFAEQAQRAGAIDAVGIASFGPVDLRTTASSFGYITSTPKAGWANTDFAGAVGRALQVPVGFDTDVNAAALGEARWGAGRGIDSLVYMTIGTGIGGGGVFDGRLMHGLIHPEMGHMRIPHDRAADPFPGCCPYHGDCFEGLACGPAMAERWGQPSETLPANHPAWAQEARYIALALVNVICTLSPERIILGGGVMASAHLFPLVRAEVQSLLADYVQSPAITENIADYIVAPGLGDRSGVLGAMALAERAAKG